MAWLESIQRRFFGGFWNPYASLVAAGVGAALYFGFTGTLWAVTGEFTRWGGNLLQLFGVDPTGWAYFKAIKLTSSPLTRSDGWLVIGMLLGSLVSALMSGHFKIRWPAHARRWVQGLVGGLLAGFGTRLAMGCNLAAFFTGLPQFSLHTWLFILGTGLGSYLGVKVAVRPFMAGQPRLEHGVRTVALAEASAKAGPHRHLWAGLVAGGATLTLTAAAIAAGHPIWGLAGLFGAAFGILIQRGQVCFTAGLRNLWLFGDGTLAKAILLGMAVQSIGTAIFIYKGVPPIIHWASLGALLGGVMFGVGIVVAGGCETGWMYRLMEGQMQFLSVAVGNVVGATVLAYGWDHWGIYQALVAPWPEVNLIHTWGWLGGLVATFAFLAALWAVVAWRERTFRIQRQARAPIPWRQSAAR
ncbi:MAG: selenium metabolism membrane protein YedE/FdhT [Firmicutes bacterium]|nr:selenium metabolism membrane protein YedE/FdhT [Bacillota bacterium]